MMEKTLEELFSDVFDENGFVKACGRGACRALILRMEACFPGVDFGNPETGCMDVAKIWTAYQNCRK